MRNVDALPIPGYSPLTRIWAYRETWLLGCIILDWSFCLTAMCGGGRLVDIGLDSNTAGHGKSLWSDENTLKLDCGQLYIYNG